MSNNKQQQRLTQMSTHTVTLEDGFATSTNGLLRQKHGEQNTRLYNKLQVNANTMLTPSHNINAMYDRTRASQEFEENVQETGYGSWFSTLRRRSTFPQPPHPADDKTIITAPADLLPATHCSSWRHKLAFNIDASGTGRRWEIFDTALNLAFCALYIYNTTFTERGLPRASRLADLVLAIVILAQYLPKIYISVDLRRCLYSPLTLLTIISCIPVFIAYSDESLRITYMSAGNNAYVYPFRFVRLHLAVMACLIPSKTSVFNVSLITRKALRLMGFILFLILTVASFVHMVAFKIQHVTKLTFFDSFFFAIVSSTSGTTSQIVPDGVFSRLVVLYVMITAAVVIPTNLSELLTLINKKSVFDHSFKRKQGQNHVVVCGQFEVTSLQSFLKEFFCPDHGSTTVNTHVVILNLAEPSESMKEILFDPAYVNRVQYVRGSAMQVRSLEKVRIHEAAACFIFSSKYATENASEDDSKTVMRALSLKKYIRNLQLHVQVLLPEHKCHFDYLADTMVCVEELKLGILAQNCRCPGFTTLIYQLTTSITDATCEQYLSAVGDHPSRVWMKEYLEGATQEIYPTILSPWFKGMKMGDVTSIIYKKFHSIVIGVAVPNKAFFRRLRRRQASSDDMYSADNRFTAADFDLHLNPPNHIIQGSELVFVITGRTDAAQRISFYRPGRNLSIHKKSQEETWYRHFFRPGSRQQSDIEQPDEEEPLMSHHESKLFVSTEPQPTTGIRFSNDTDAPEERLARSDSNNSIMHLLSNRRKSVKRVASYGAKLINTAQASASADLIPTELFGVNEITSSRSVSNSSLIDQSSNTLVNGDEDSDDSDDEKSQTKEPSSIVKQQFKDNSFVSRILQQAIGFSSFKSSSKSDSEDQNDNDDDYSDRRGSEMSSGDSYESTAVPSVSRYPDRLRSSVTSHIIVCDSSPSFPGNIEYFVAPLRSPHLESGSATSFTPIVILSTCEPSDYQKRLLEKFDEVYVIRGSPLSRRDLHRAGVTRCRKAVVLANSSNGKNNPERTADAASLLVVMNLEAMASRENIFIVTEFIHTENMHLIGDSNLSAFKNQREMSAKTLLRPAFMAGHVYAQSMLDTVICQNYYNPHMLNILRHMIFSGIFHIHNVTAQKERDQSQSNYVLSSKLNTDAKSRKPAVVEVTTTQHSHIWIVKVPSVLGGQTFASLFEYLVTEHGATAIGLYRRAPKSPYSTSSSPPANSPNSNISGHGLNTGQGTSTPHRYVYVNPSPDTVLRADDRVYLLATIKPNL